MDAWELRCWFRHEQFLERLQAGHLKEFIFKSTPVKYSSGLKTGTLSQDVRYIDSVSNTEVARIHRYVLPDSGSTTPDPKYVIVDGVRFTMFDGGDAIKRDPCNLFPGVFKGRLRKPYGFFRKLCCRVLGPERDGRLAADMTPLLRSLFFFWDSSRA